MLDEFGDSAGLPDTYRGWSIRWVKRYWQATGPDYLASWKSMDDRWVELGDYVLAATRELLLEAIDAWILKNNT